MTTSTDDILELYLQRKAAAGPLAGVMREIRDTYNGDVVVPLPELEKNERSATANLLAQGLDQMSDRFASVMPDTKFTPRRTGEAEEKRVRNKRKALDGMHDANRLSLKLTRRGRHLMGYGTSPVVIRPNFTTNSPMWVVGDPLASYPSPMQDPDDPCVYDNITCVERTLGWLQRRYPDEASILLRPEECPRDTAFEVIEYIDCDELVTAVVGKSDEGMPYRAMTGRRPIVELERVENRAGVCWAVVPGRISLDRRKGQFDGMVGMYRAQARMFALEMIAVEQGIFPDEWLVARQGEEPKIIQVAKGREGQVGLVQGGDLRQQTRNPGQMTYPTIDRLERAQRLDAGIPAEFGGESQTNVRTGRRGENILSATIDFTLMHVQRVMGYALEAENARAIAIDKGYHDTAKSFYVGGVGTDYKPSDLWDSDQNTVSYAMAGGDVNALVVSSGQRVGMGTMSKLGFMEMDPLIEDPEQEMDRIVAEGLEAAMLSGIQEQAASGAIPPGDVARIAQLVKDDKMDLAKAIETAQREAQERQATQAEPTSPEAQPGLAQPGMGAEMAPIPEEPLGPSPENLSRLLASLRRPQALQAPGEAPRPEAMV